MDETNFTDLMARARSGDPAAIREFLDRFEEEVRVMVRARLPRKLRPQFDEEDFAQAVWQSFFAEPEGAPRKFENEAHLRKFLHTLVRAKVQEQHRVAWEDREVLREVASPEFASPDPSPSETAQADDRLEQLTAGFGPREIEVLMLRRQGLTHAEVAERTGMNERSVRRIIEAFRSRLEGPDEFGSGNPHATPGKPRSSTDTGAPSPTSDFGKQVLTVYLDPGDAPSELITEFYLALDALYRAHGGSGLKVITEERRSLTGEVVS